MMTASLKLDKRGLSIVEMLIALALLGIVLALGYTFFFFGQNSFGIGTRQYNVQNNIRIAADLIAEEVRYAAYLEIIKNDSDILYPINAFDSYIYVDGNEIVVLSSNSTLRYPAGQTGSDIEFSPSSTNKILNFTITGRDNQQAYSIYHEVVSLNLELSPPDTIQGISEGHVLRYQTIDHFLAGTLSPELENYATSGNTLTLTFNRNINSFTETPEGLPLSASIDGSNLVIVAGTLANNVEYTINYGLDFPGLDGDYEISVDVTVKRTGTNYTWTFEQVN